MVKTFPRPTGESIAASRSSSQRTHDRMGVLRVAHRPENRRVRNAKRTGGVGALRGYGPESGGLVVMLPRGRRTCRPEDNCSPTVISVPPMAQKVAALSFVWIRKNEIAPFYSVSERIKHQALQGPFPGSNTSSPKAFLHDSVALQGQSLSSVETPPLHCTCSAGDA